MTSAIELLHDLAVVMIVAGITTILFQRLRQPVALGYIVAGVIIGPHTPPFTLVRNEEAVRTLGDMGIVMLMFSLGLEFSLRKLTRVGISAFGAAALEIALMIWIGYELGRAFGWTFMDSIFLGAMLSISSTTIIVKALAELNKSKEGFAGIIFGILIIEDILAIVLLALLSGFARTGTPHASEVGLEMLKLAVFFAVVLVVGLLFVPRLMDYVDRRGSSEMMLITTLALCFGVALLASMLNYSIALGAFLIGTVVAETRQIHKIATLTGPVRDMFSAIFFVTIGMLIDPPMLLQYAGPIAAISAAVIVGKVATCSFGVFIGGRDVRTSLCVGMGLAQIGEFSFIIATLGLALHVTDSFLYPIAVAVSAITTLVTPYLIRSAEPTAAWIDRTMPAPVTQSLAVYTAWVGSWGNQNPGPLVLVVQQLGRQLFLNLLLTIGAFALGAWFVAVDVPYLPKALRAPEMNQALVWVTVMLLTSPIYLASFRKLTAMSALVAEVCFPIERGTDNHGGAVRAVISHVFILGALVVMTFITILLSTSILGSFESLLLLIIPVLIFIMLFRSKLVRLYSRAQIALHETMLELPALAHGEDRPLPELLREAELETIEIPTTAAMAGRALREIPLRTRTGASIVAIERSGQRLINPGPEEVLQAGDRVLLIGQADQLPGARDLLLAASAGPAGSEASR
jgi:CPA2 family monovalent cation:H+ antiporter-2